MSDNAVLAAAIQNATCVVHYDYPQKKSEFENRLGCLIESITNNVSFYWILCSQVKVLFLEFFT